MARHGGRSLPREPDAGVVVALTPSGRIVARCAGPSAPEEGTEVVGADRNFRGTVVRVFGPVARPYLTVQPRRSPRATEAVGLIGSTLSAREVGAR